MTDGRVVLEPVRTASSLAFDHDQFVRFATEHVRREHETGPDPFTLLSETLTQLDLQHLHEAVDGNALIKDTLRRRLQQHLTETSETRDGLVGKPARLWARQL